MFADDTNLFYFQNLNWKSNLTHVRNKISKNIGILYKLRHLVDEKSLTQLYFSYINSYINYGNCTWGSTNKTSLKPIYIKQKQAARAIFFKDRYTHANPLLKKMNALDVYQINIFKHLCFMFNYIHDVTPATFKNRFAIVSLYMLHEPQDYSKNLFAALRWQSFQPLIEHRTFGMNLHLVTQLYLKQNR